MLLPSGPDMVHRFPLRKTQPSTPLVKGRPNNYDASNEEFNPARADCGLQGAATSPSSTTNLLPIIKCQIKNYLAQTLKRAQSLVYLFHLKSASGNTEIFFNVSKHS
ncbi:hypothetical protein AN409_07945 [Listeria monocytogenes]